MRFRLDGRGGRIVRRSLTAGFDPDQPRDDHGRWSATVEHAYNGESEHSFESHREEIPTELNKIIGRAEGGPAMVNHATVEDDKGNIVYRYSGRNGGEFTNPDGSPVTASATSAAEQAETLLAAADSLAANYELTQGSLAGRLFYARALEVGYREIGGSEWPYEGELAEIDDPLIRDDRGVVFELPDGTLAWLALGYGWFHATVAAPTRDAVTEAFEAFAAQYPALYREAVDDQTVPITFWTDSKNGPVSRLRIIDASPWGEIERNYSREVRDALGPLMKDFEPGKSGQLLLWQGPPGTGKSWALRALASEWRSWAEFNYITDPDAFFVTNPSYLIDVLLHESYEELVVLEEEGDAEVVSTDKLGKWRVLILEDTGELLAANAKESYGQGLSRLLNVVDGLVGQGLRVLVLVTTNDELGELHPAVKRPGRCASQIEFGPLSAEDASAWLGEETDEGGTLAELYARRGEGEEALGEAGEEPVTASAEEEEETAAERWDKLAREIEDELAADLDPVASQPASRAEALTAAVEALVASSPMNQITLAHEKTLASVNALFASAAGEAEVEHLRDRAQRGDALAARALGVLAEFARRPTPAPHFHVNVPEQQAPDVHVQVEAPQISPPDVHVRVEPPALTIEAAAPPNVEVRPEIRVEAARAPDVRIEPPAINLTVEQPPRPSSVRAIKEDDGSTVFTVEPDDDEE